MKWAYHGFVNWTPLQLQKAKKSLAELWSKYNHPIVTAPVATARPPPTSGFQRWMNTMTPVTGPADELEQYLHEPIIEAPERIIDWWKLQRERLPTLTRMAMNVYSIPSMSSEPERVFSGAKHTISDARASLKADTIEALECCKSVFRAGLFTDVEVNAMMTRMEEEELEQMEALEDER